jgi:crossover junction endodeoxyribonuclease RusA
VTGPVGETTKRRWHLPLPYTKPPLTLNSRLHHYRRYSLEQNAQQAAWALARSKKVPACKRIAVELHYQPPRRVRMDGDNLIAFVKPLVDGLVKAGVVPDDDHTHVVHYSPVIHDPEKGQRHGLLWLLVTDLGDQEAADA